MVQVTTDLELRSEEPDEAGQADRAYATLLRAIATCELVPGALLNERKEAAGLGMSRTPFREALHRLESDGLVTARRNRKVRVSLLDREIIEGHLVVREALEAELLRRIITERRPVDFSRLKTLVADMRAAIRDADVHAYLGADEEFHLTICRAAKNAPALEALQRAWIHVNRVRYLEPGDARNLRGSLAEHQRLLAALRRRDERAAQITVAEHMDRGRGLLSDLMRDLPEVFVARTG